MAAGHRAGKTGRLSVAVEGSSCRLETGNDSYRFKASSETAKKKRKETVPLTTSLIRKPNGRAGQISVTMLRQF